MKRIISILARSALVGFALSLALVASAIAWRAPTTGERRAITAVAAAVPHAGGSRVTVKGIRISTVGPWASAGLTIYVDGQPDFATDILHKLHGKWRNASWGTSGEWCVLPRQDRRNLGFSASSPCGTG